MIRSPGRDEYTTKISVTAPKELDMEIIVAAFATAIAAFCFLSIVKQDVSEVKETE